MGSSKRHLLLWLAIVGSILACVLARSPTEDFYRAQPCNGMLQHYEGKELLLKLNGSRATVYPKTPGSDNYFKDAAIIFQLSEVGEFWLRNNTEGTKGKCKPVDGSSNSPLMDQPTLVQSLHNCQCTLTNFTQSEPGFYADGFLININNCPSPQQHLNVQLNYSISNSTRIEEWPNTMPGSTLDSFDYIQMPHAVKISGSVTNWTWAEHPNDQQKANFSYLALGFQLGIISKGVPMKVAQKREQAAIHLYVDVTQANLHAQVDAGYILDGVPVILAPENDELLFDFDLTNGTQGVPIMLPTRFPLCPPYNSNTNITSFDKYSHLLYDPSLGVIFSPLLTPKQGAKQNRAWVIAVAVCVPVVFVLVVAIILASFVVPKVRSALRPYSERQPLPS